MVSAERPKRWLLRRPDPDAPARLFCFPYSGVGASMYKRWPGRIGDTEVCRVQLPARENRVREPHYGTYEKLAEDLVDGLRPYLDRPFGFFGHCGGALPAFATALLLARRDLPVPARLFISSQVAPHDGPYGRFLHLTDDELTDELSAFVVAMGGTPHPDLLELGLSTLKSDIAANRAYRLPSPVVLPSVIQVLGWEQDDEVRPALMTGWAEYARPGDVRSAVLAGGHHAFLTAPEELLSLLGAAMDDAVAEAVPA
ncbi:thioesterase domain-containing protein [Actinoplanes sp. NPDC051470]|uniref:thioesterase II family protein n=1 Tax=unclassified Actinoplanes TaxID=2626549 RepID=UPI00343F3858